MSNTSESQKSMLDELRNQNTFVDIHLGWAIERCKCCLAASALLPLPVFS